MKKNNDFTKKDLNTGMILTTRNGDEYTVILGLTTNIDKVTDIIIDDSKFCWKLKEYNDDLTYPDCPKLDIIKVESPSRIIDCFTFSDGERTTLWERQKEYNKDANGFDWETFAKGKIEVGCASEKEAKDFCKSAHKQGFVWIDKDSLLTCTAWSEDVISDEGMLYYSIEKGDPIYGEAPQGMVCASCYSSSCKQIKWSDYMDEKTIEQDEISLD